MEEIIGPIVWKVLPTVNEKINILPTVKRKESDWIGQILRRIGLLIYVIEGNMEQ
jgi:hypothetical protein